MRQRPANVGPATWLDVELPSVAENLALDEALLDEAHESPAASMVVRTWMAAEPVVVLGSSSTIGGEIDALACQSAGVPLIRRPGGGLTVVAPGGDTSQVAADDTPSWEMLVELKPHAVD